MEEKLINSDYLWYKLKYEKEFRKQYTYIIIHVAFLLWFTAHSADSKDIWIQGVKDDSVWKFHDGLKMPDFLNDYMVESNNSGEIHLRYIISKMKFHDIKPSDKFSYVCEYRFD